MRKKEKNKIKYIFTIIWFCGFFCFGFLLLEQEGKYAKARQEYEKLNDNVGAEGLKAPISGNSVPEDILKNINSDYLFWLSIPETEISYPVVKSPEPGFYLNHTFYKTENPGGCLFVQEDITGLENKNTVIFGHNMKDGTMFSGLKKYKKEEYYKLHKKIQLFYKGRWREGIIFSCQIRKEEDLSSYQTKFANLTEEKKFIRKMQDSSIYEIFANIPDDGVFITLSTCYGKSERMIVQAVLM